MKEGTLNLTIRPQLKLNNSHYFIPTTLFPKLTHKIALSLNTQDILC
jgi:hypothetical protein